ncbi:MAG: helix-turn-helix domain-containing protein [Opitutae bacterium]|nr:helix-turn-helix domain-containing protein [Opitutae bacterium]
MPKSSAPSIKSVVALLPHPPHQLFGRRGAPPVLPENVVCFQRRTASELNRPRQGRALHHRFVLIFALETAGTVCVDDRAIPLRAGEGLLIFPFQFHHYIQLESDRICWLFVTFERTEHETLEGLRYQPFVLTQPLTDLATELVAAYERQRAADLPILLLALLLARIRQEKPAPRANANTLAPSGLVTKVNRLAYNSHARLDTKGIAKALGISGSHLRACFHASCGVSLGRHLRRLRLEKACGLLRLGQQRVSEIAEVCGFASIYSFSRAFRSAYGVSPLVYRRGAAINNRSADKQNR